MTKTRKIKVTKADGTTEIVDARKFRKPKSHAAFRRTAHWRKICRLAFDRDGGKCAVCKGRSGDTRLEVHHVTYDRLGEELLTDVLLMCQRCHATEHQWQRRLGKAA